MLIRNLYGLKSSPMVMIGGELLVNVLSKLMIDGARAISHRRKYS